MHKILLALLLSFPVHAALNDVDKAQVLHQNMLLNPGFENGLVGWTASGGAVVLITSGSNLLKGKRSVTWDASAAAQTYCSALVPVEEGDKGENGLSMIKIKTPSGTATHTLFANDGSNPVGPAVTVTSDANGVITQVNFIYPTSGSVQLCIEAQADEPLIAIDLGYQGFAANITEVQLQDVFSAKVSSTDVVTDENEDFIDGDCTNATVGEATCVFNAGFFTVAPNCHCTNADGGVTCRMDSVSSTDVTVFTFNSAIAKANIDFSLTCQKAGVDAPVQAFKADQTAGSRVRVHTHNGYGSTNTVIERFTTIIEDVGSAIIYVDDATDGASFTIARDGIYSISYSRGAKGGIGVCVSGISLNSSALTTIIVSITAADRLAFHHYSGSTQTVNTTGCTASWVGWLVKNDIVRPHVSTTVPETAAFSTFSIAHVTSSQSAPLVKFMTIFGTNLVTKGCRFTCQQGASHTCNSDFDGCILSIVDEGAGASQINFTTGYWGGLNVQCEYNLTQGSTHGNCATDSSVDGSSVDIRCYNGNGGTQVDRNFDAFCWGNP